MFMCSGQLFSQGESASSSHTPARQRVRHDVVFEFVAEMSQGRQNRIRRSLSQTAQRAFANVAAQFIQKFKMMRGSCPFRDRG